MLLVFGELQYMYHDQLGQCHESCYSALRKIDGLEWLADLDIDDILPDDEFYVDDDNREKSLSGRLYLIFTNYRGLQEMLSLWNIYKNNPQAPQFNRGRAKWKHLFNQLKDIHVWGPEDRLYETGLMEDWQERVSAGEETVRLEIELWYRSSLDKQKLSEADVERLIKEL